MTDTEDKKTAESRDSKTIRIEMSGKAFENMCRMMSGFGGGRTYMSECCEMPRDNCCPQSEDDTDREITIVIKRKG